MIKINLKAHLMSAADDMWVVVSTQKDDIPIAVTVDGATKDMLMKMQKLYNEIPDAIIDFFVKKHKEICRYINSLKVPEDFVFSDLASIPLLGVTNSVEDGNVVNVKFMNALRLLHFFVTPVMFEAFNYIAENYAKNPLQYYYAYTHYFDFFERTVRKNGKISNH